jgi:hypothetical protein
MKSFTDISQGKKLAEILPLESADMHYARIMDDFEAFEWTPLLSPIPKVCATYIENVPCWGLAALLDVIPSGKALIHDKGNLGYKCICNNMDTYFHDNPLDACYEMIIKLHEQNIL